MDVSPALETWHARTARGHRLKMNSICGSALRRARAGHAVAAAAIRGRGRSRQPGRDAGRADHRHRRRRRQCDANGLHSAPAKRAASSRGQHTASATAARDGCSALLAYLQVSRRHSEVNRSHGACAHLGGGSPGSIPPSLSLSPVQHAPGLRRASHPTHHCVRHTPRACLPPPQLPAAVQQARLIQQALPRRPHPGCPSTQEPGLPRPGLRPVPQQPQEGL